MGGPRHAHWSYEGSTGPSHWGSLKAQLATFTRIYNGNNRPVQKLNGRTVFEDTAAK